MITILSLIIVLLLLSLFLIWRTASKTMRRIDEMISSAFDGTFSERGFNESSLSKLETKMYRYLQSGAAARKQINADKNAVQTLVSDISHQTKTPISNILLYVQLLGEVPQLDESAREIAAQIENQTEKLNFLVQSLVKTSRLENRIVEVAPKENDVRELIEGAAAQYRAAADKKGLRLAADLPPRMAAKFDFKWTREALDNLIDNAVKYTPAGGSVELSAQSYELFVRIDVRDTGIGISEEESAKIFSRFYRSPRVSEENGVGIGLYLVREILSKQGGYVKVSSKPGEGTVFSMFLPK